MRRTVSISQRLIHFLIGCGVLVDAAVVSKDVTAGYPGILIRDQHGVLHIGLLRNRSQKDLIEKRRDGIDRTVQTRIKRCRNDLQRIALFENGRQVFLLHTVVVDDEQDLDVKFADLVFEAIFGVLVESGLLVLENRGGDTRNR